MGNLKKVLIVDDYHVVPVLIANYLDRSGFATRTASNGLEALEKFQLEEPELLIADTNLPDMNGFELTRRVRAISNIPIVIMSAGSGYMGDDKDAAIDSGADVFLMKPFDLVDLLDEIKGLLARTQSGVACREVANIGKS